MVQQNAVEIVDVFMVDPLPASPPDNSCTPPPSPNYLPLTFFDIQWLRSPPLQRLYFYQTSAKTTSFFDSILPKLKHSLSLTLHHFLPLAGNLTWPLTSRKPVVVYAKGDTVSLSVAHSNADFCDLSGGRTSTELREATECHPLLPNLPVSAERVKVLAIQLTVFPKSGGFSIGIAASHGVLDGKSINLFIKSWAHICKSLSHVEEDKLDQYSSVVLPLELKPIYDRTLMKEPAKLKSIFDSNQCLNRSLLPWEPEVEPDSVRGTFRFPRAKIEKLRRLMLALNENEEHDHGRHLSAFSLTCAYTWVCLVKTEEIDQDKVLLIFPVDCRTRFDPPIGSSYFGNGAGIKYVVAEREALLGEEGFCVAVNAISEAITSLDNIDGLVNEAENRASSVMSCNNTNFPLRVAAAGGVYPVFESNRFDVYKTDFGWGSPKKVDMLSVDGIRAMGLADSRDGDGGVEIGLALKKHHMKAFASLFAQALE